ncbi:hypothetical protein H4S07_005587 [Coemansia furcata]|uniref:Uncharacterized protein n=1 Tax=Coemansia furcata TaxID=417177 RepID=A0ACC1L220_9FUNG|nr:hypothetical protein H4S07_005587 [Coemansia furcata]
MPQQEQRQQQQQLSPKQPPQSSTYSSKITQETGCHIYRYTNNGDTVDQSLHQIVGSNGKVYVEYIPGHSLVYIPSSASPTIVMGQMMANSRQGRLKEKSPKNARPSNVFFKYRSHKLPELTVKYPKLNQTVISRMVADHWKAESDEVKDRFKLQYKNEMIQYEVAKKLSRYQSSVIPREYREEDFTDNPSTYSPFSTAPTHMSGPPSASSNHEPAQHQSYPTLPTTSPRRQQLSQEPKESGHSYQ